MGAGAIVMFVGVALSARYVVKPMDFNALADVTRQAGFYWLAINRSMPQ